MIRDPWKPQNLLISRLLGRNSKIWSVAQNKVTIQVSMQKIRLLASLVWSSDMCGSKKLLLIFYSEYYCTDFLPICADEYSNHPPTAQTEHARDLKFCMLVPWGNRLGTIEAIIDELPSS